MEEDVCRQSEILRDPVELIVSVSVMMQLQGWRSGEEVEGEIGTSTWISWRISLWDKGEGKYWCP